MKQKCGDDAAGDVGKYKERVVVPILTFFKPKQI